MLSTNNVTLMFSISLGGRKRICNRGPDRNYLTRHHHQDHRPLRITRNRGERGCVNQVNVINQEIVIHQRVENQTNINLSKSKNIVTVDNEEIDKGWNGVKTLEQRNLVRRHIVSDSRRLRNSNVVEVAKSKTTSNPKLAIIPNEKKTREGRVSNIIVPTVPDNKSNLNEVVKKENDQTSRVTLQERKRQALTLKKAEEEKARQAYDAQKKVEEQRARVTLQERKRTELAQKKAEEEKGRQARDAQKKVEEQRARITLQERKRAELAQRKAQEEKIRQARDAQKKIEEQRARITLQERQRNELAQRKLQEEKIRRTRAVQSQQSINNSKTRNLSKPLPVRQTSKSQPSSNSRSFSRNIPNKETSRRVIQKPTTKKTSKTFSRSIQK